MVTFVQPDTRFGTSAPVGFGRRPTMPVQPVTAQRRSIPQVRATATPISDDNQLAGSGREFESRSVGGAAGGTGASLTLAGLNPSSLYSANQALDSDYGKAGILGAALVNPALGLAGLGARYATNPDSFLGKALYGDSASFYSAAKQGGPLNTPVAKPARQPSASGVATGMPRELTLTGKKSSGNGGGGGGSSFTNDSGGRGGGSGGDYAGRDVGGVGSFGGSASTNTSGSFGGYSGGAGSYADRDFGGFSFEKGGTVPGKGPVDATLHGGEFVMNRDMVKAAGKGSIKRGQERLEQVMHKLATLKPRER